MKEAVVGIQDPQAQDHRSLLITPFKAEFGGLPILNDLDKHIPKR